MLYILSFFLGAFNLLSFSPYNFKLAIIISFLYFFYVIEKSSLKEIFIHSFLFGFAYFIFSTYWLYDVIILYSNVNSISAYILLTIFCIYLSLFIIFPSLIYFFSYKKLNNNFFALILFSSSLTLFEILRAYLFSGFSWNNFGQVVLDTYFSSYLKIIGVYGCSLVILLLCVSIYCIKSKTRFSAIMFLLLLTIPFYENAVTFTKPHSSKIVIYGLQSNIKQESRWTKKSFTDAYNYYFETTKKIINDENDANNYVVIWPEAAIPSLFKSYQPEIKKLYNEYGSNFDLIIGAFFKDEDKIYNSIINTKNNDLYHKSHLVPFGEYMPLRNIFNFLYEKINVPMTDISSSSHSKKISSFGNDIQVSICYESIFQHINIVDNKNIKFYLNVTNDGWFGDTSAPVHHLDALRLRAIENERPFIRVATTGISAFINEQGEIISSLKLNKEGYMRFEVEPRTGKTFFSKYQNNTLFLIIFIIIFISYRKSKVD